MILTTTECISGIQVDTLGLVQGTGARAGTDDGESDALACQLEGAQRMAQERMIRAAERLGADGIVSMRYASIALGEKGAGVIAYGTAVKFQ